MPQPFRTGNHIQLIRGGEEYFAALEALIDSAVLSLHIQVYSLDPDSTGAMVVDRLAMAAQRGVEVHLLVDAFGGQALTREHMDKITALGISVRKYAPMFKGIRFRLGQRLHHKIALADQQSALIGGINLSDKYRGTEQEPAWLDYALRLSGPIGQDIFRLCREMWPEEQRRQMLVPPPAKTGGDGEARLSRNNLKKRKMEITKSYVQAIYNAREEIILLSPYFIPGIRMLNALSAARRRGVRVVLIVQGISDVPFIHRATEYLYDWLLDMGIEIREWHDSILHGKVLVTDASWMTLGSYNPNALSDYFSHELNVEIRNKYFARQMHHELADTILPRCKRVTSSIVRKRYAWLHRLTQAFSYSILWLACRLAIPDRRLLQE